MHQAVQSLRIGESTIACVAGANIMLAPEAFIIEASLHMLSPEGKSKMWDASANGYARVCRTVPCVYYSFHLLAGGGGQFEVISIKLEN